LLDVSRGFVVEVRLGVRIEILSARLVLLSLALELINVLS